MDAALTNILAQFVPVEELLEITPFGNGHINDTYRVRKKGGEELVLQRLNRYVFKNPAQVMENIAAVTAFLREKITALGGDADRETLRVIPTRDGALFFADEEGEPWRCFPFITGAVSFDTAETPEMFAESGRAFGRFQYLLSDFPAESLHETIPHFHDTAARLQTLWASAEADARGRAGQVRRELDFIAERKARAEELGQRLAAGELQLRVTHNDTKLNNVMIDEKTGRGLCVIDLDTVMPGLAVHDFGDAIRYGANTAAEDEPDAGKVSCDLRLYEAYTQGYLAGSAGSLTRAERELLPLGAWTMTMEVGMRFLTDYLDGDVYFKTAYPEHNLVRARTQLALALDMEKKWDELARITRVCTQ